jgi:hypothetical protein
MQCVTHPLMLNVDSLQSALRHDDSRAFREAYRSAEAKQRALLPATTVAALLRSAVVSDAVACVTFLVHECNADVVNARDFADRSLLWQAAARSPALVDTILKCRGIDVNAMDSAGAYGTPLMHAARAGSKENVRLLLDAGADANLCTPSTRDTALIVAVKAHDQSTLVRLLLAAGARVNDVDAKRRTAMHWAANFCRDRCARALLVYGADCSVVDERNETPLMLAQRFRRAHDPVLSLLQVPPRQQLRSLLFKIAVALKDLELPVLLVLLIFEQAAHPLLEFLPTMHVQWEIARKVRETSAK